MKADTEKSAKQATRYTVTLPSGLEESLEAITSELEISKSEAFRRALTLLNHAAKADQVILMTKDGEKQTVLLK